MSLPARRFLFAAGLLPVVAAVQAFAAPAPATSDPLDTLMADSPFKPSGSATVAAGQNGPLELRSVVFERGAYLFSLYDQTAKESFWASLNEPGFPFIVRSFDRATDTLTIEQQGRTVSLTLAASKTAPFTAQVQSPQQGMPGVAPANGGPPYPTQQQGANSASGGPVAVPTPGNGSNLASLPAEEAQRLQRIADEIRRRRNIARPTPVPTPATQKP